MTPTPPRNTDRGRSTRGDHYRPAPLTHSDKFRVFDVDEGVTRIYAAPGYLVFIERMWHGDFQQVPVDPERVQELIDALQRAADYAYSEDADDWFA